MRVFCHVSILPESIHSFIISLLFSSRTTQKLPAYRLGKPSLFIAILQICKDPEFLKISHNIIFKIIENLLEFYLTPLRKFLLVLIGFLETEIIFTEIAYIRIKTQNVVNTGFIYNLPIFFHFRNNFF